MTSIKFYQESELVQMLQDGEYDWLDFVNHHSPEWQKEYVEYCKNNGQIIDNESAEEFVDYKGRQLEQALVEGNA